MPDALTEEEDRLECFTTWLVMLGRLPTRDRLHVWKIVEDKGGYCFCQGEESHQINEDSIFEFNSKLMRIPFHA
ncbi:hypothetical protein LIER_42017 [Lithospermum erythrorhizon]|uniref:Uncharacterized protein n=1 Tax=Lithospermum erythrorhizon TaxID=34254 RepID=A0AAV3RN66_LITER